MTVCAGMARIVQEMRGHGETETAQRVSVVQTMASETLQVLGIDGWIEQHGGFVSINIDTTIWLGEGWGELLLSDTVNCYVHVPSKYVLHVCISSN